MNYELFAFAEQIERQTGTTVYRCQSFPGTFLFVPITLVVYFSLPEDVPRVVESDQRRLG